MTTSDVLETLRIARDAEADGKDPAPIIAQCGEAWAFAIKRSPYPRNAAKWSEALRQAGIDAGLPSATWTVQPCRAFPTAREQRLYDRRCFAERVDSFTTQALIEREREWRREFFSATPERRQADAHALEQFNRELRESRCEHCGLPYPGHPCDGCGR